MKGAPKLLKTVYYDMITTIEACGLLHRRNVLNRAQKGPRGNNANANADYAGKSKVMHTLSNIEHRPWIKIK